ncbi:MAG: T9SS type A sorting domain-containing protein [Bacteroidales bacterium]|jgi:hypothetical protein|nr:T9SS type A sorting domain-containing protein [Bacteroidales bacterium]
MVYSRNLTSSKTTRSLLILILAMLGIVIMDSAKAQQNIRDNFLVDKISRYESASNYASAEYIYDTDNKLLKIVCTGKMIENGQVRDLKYVDVFEYENDRVSKVHSYDSTHFMFSYDIHFFYNLQKKLIRKEYWMNGSRLGRFNYHYENGRVVSIYNDNTMPFELDTIVYDNLGNVSKHIEIYPKLDMFGQPIPGEFEVRELYYEYDRHPRPNFGLDYLFAFPLIPWLGTAFPCEISFLSNNNMTKAIYEQNTYNYTYNEYGLPETVHDIFDPIGPHPGSLLTITYKQIGETNISGVTQIEKINIYPNPSKDKFFIECENFSAITLYDMLGREVLNQNINGTSEINISQLPKGIYVIRVLSENKVIGSSKIVKQ